MAPASRGEALAHRPLSKADGNGFDPPPSTMAAQLINNLSTPTKPSRQVEQEDLKKLMDEVSNQEASIAEFSNAETKLEHKHKLIYVFARAVLERLAGDDPFLDVQKMIPQASDALDIFMSTIKEIPDVLAYCVGPGFPLLSRGQEPLWFWLFPRVLALLGRRQCDALTEKIKDFFYVSFQVVARSPKLWTLSSLFFCYFKDCTTSIHHIQAFS
jgi:serine/threonine-protein kinase ATR